MLRAMLSVDRTISAPRKPSEADLPQPRAVVIVWGLFREAAGCRFYLNEVFAVEPAGGMAAQVEHAAERKAAAGGRRGNRFFRVPFQHDLAVIGVGNFHDRPE